MAMLAAPPTSPLLPPRVLALKFALVECFAYLSVENSQFLSREVDMNFHLLSTRGHEFGESSSMIRLVHQGCHSPGTFIFHDFSMTFHD